MLAGDTLTAAYQEASDVTALTDGRLAAIWYDLKNQMSCAQLYNADGSRAEADFLVETVNQSNPSYPTVCVPSCRGFMMA